MDCDQSLFYIEMKKPKINKNSSFIAKQNIEKKKK